MTYSFYRLLLFSRHYARLWVYKNTENPDPGASIFMGGGDEEYEQLDINSKC